MLGAHNDITEQMEMDQDLKASLTSLDETYKTTRLALEESETLFNLSPDAMLQVDEAGTIHKVNLQAERIFGYSSAELLGMGVDRLLPSHLQQAHDTHRSRYASDPAIRPMGDARSEITAMRKDGSIIPVEVRLAPIETSYGRRIISVIRDVTETQAILADLREQIEQNENLLRENQTDMLTGIGNRRGFETAFVEEFQASRSQGGALALLLFDLDRFKAINDRYGHDMGDRVLKKVAQVGKALFPDAGNFSRIGGEEFALTLRGKNLAEACGLAEQARQEFETLRVEGADGIKVPITASFGVAEASSGDDNHENLFRRCDEALYLAKSRGRNRVEPAPE